MLRVPKQVWKRSDDARVDGRLLGVSLTHDSSLFFWDLEKIDKDTSILIVKNIFSNLSRFLASDFSEG